MSIMCNQSHSSSFFVELRVRTSTTTSNSQNTIVNITVVIYSQIVLVLAGITCWLVVEARARHAQDQRLHVDRSDERSKKKE
jgi:hypothetical protein